MKKYLSIGIILLLLTACAKPTESVPTASSLSTESIAQVEESAVLTKAEIWAEQWDEVEWAPTEKPASPYKLYEEKEYAPNPESENAGGYYLYGEYQENLPPINNDTPLKNLISEIDSPWYVAAGMSSLRDDHTSSRETTLYGIMNTQIADTFIDCLPFSYLRKNDAGYYYSVFKLKDGGYAYYFFEERYTIHYADDQTYLGFEKINDAVDETDLVFIGTTYLDETLSYSDIENIKIGTPITEVAKTVPSALMTKYRHDCYEYIFEYGDANTLVYYQPVILVDGVAEIGYEYADGALAVKSIKYFPDYEYYPSDCMFNENDNIFSVNLKILEQDYPPVN